MNEKLVFVKILIAAEIESKNDKIKGQRFMRLQKVRRKDGRYERRGQL